MRVYFVHMSSANFSFYLWDLIESGLNKDGPASTPVSFPVCQKVNCTASREDVGGGRGRRGGMKKEEEEASLFYRTDDELAVAWWRHKATNLNNKSCKTVERNAVG